MEYGDKISTDKKEAIQRALSDLKDAHKNKDVAAIDRSMEALNGAWSAASEEMYKATEAQGGPSSQGQAGEQAGSETKSENNVTDVPYEEVKEDKK